MLSGPPRTIKECAALSDKEGYLETRWPTQKSMNANGNKCTYLINEHHPNNNHPHVPIRLSPYRSAVLINQNWSFDPSELIYGDSTSYGYQLESQPNVNNRKFYGRLPKRLPSHHASSAYLSYKDTVAARKWQVSVIGKFKCADCYLVGHLFGVKKHCSYTDWINFGGPQTIGNARQSCIPIIN